MLTTSKAKTVADAVALIPNNATIMIGGFMGVGSPNRNIDEILRQGQTGLTIIANDTARPKVGIGKLIDRHQVKKVVVSHIGTNPETQRQMIAGELEVELVPQGTLAERVRAAGCGLGGILTSTGAGTIVEEHKLKMQIGDVTYLVEMPIYADFALINARRADYLGNLEYCLTARNFNPLMAMAGASVIAEATEIVPTGSIPPDSVVTPGVLVDHLVIGA